VDSSSESSFEENDEKEVPECNARANYAKAHYEQVVSKPTSHGKKELFELAASPIQQEKGLSLEAENSSILQWKQEMRS
jgi:hypothetical protein